MTVVLDASIGSRGLIRSQLLISAEAILIGSDRVVVPDIFRQETYSAIFKAERRGNISAESAGQARRVLDNLDCRYAPSGAYVARAYEMALRFRQADIYDAIYLVCANDIGAELWTCDRKFVASFGRLRPTNLKLCPDDVPDGGAGG